MPFFKRKSTTKKSYRRRPRRAMIRRPAFRQNTYFFVRWDSDNQYGWFINRPGFGPAWQTEPNPGGGGGNIYSAKTVRPRISLSQVVQNAEFVALFRWFKIKKVITYIDMNYESPPEFMAQKVSGIPATGGTAPINLVTTVAESATYAPPESASIYRPSRIFRVYTWLDRTTKLYQPTDINVLTAAKQIPSLKMYTARKRVVIVSRPTGILTGQISGQQNPAPPALPPVQAPMIQTRAWNWISTDQNDANFFAPVFAVQPICPLGFDIPNWWGVNFTVSQKYYLEFKGTR